MFRWSDFSWRVQSYLCLKVSQQKVHLNMRSGSCMFLALFLPLLRVLVAWLRRFVRDLAEWLEFTERNDDSLAALSRLVVDEGPRYVRKASPLEGLLMRGE